MGNDDEIKAGLKSAGIPESVFSTTLLLEKAQPVRDLVISRSLEKVGLYIHPLSVRDMSYARKVFYLAAKELFLSGISVYCIPLARLVDRLKDTEYGNEDYMLEEVDAVFIVDFYESGAPTPLQAYDAANVRAWVKNRFESGRSVSFLSDAATDKVVDWWPPSFMAFISDNTVQQGLRKI